MMKFHVYYTRTLTLHEEIEAGSRKEAEAKAEVRYGQLANQDFEDADGDWELVLRCYTCSEVAEVQCRACKKWYCKAHLKQHELDNYRGALQAMQQSEFRDEHDA